MGNRGFGKGVVTGAVLTGLAGLLISATPKPPSKAFDSQAQQHVLNELYAARGQLCFPDQTNDVPEYQQPFRFDDRWPDPQRASEQITRVCQRYAASFDPAIYQDLLSLAGRLNDGQPGNDVRNPKKFTANQWVSCGEANEHTYAAERNILDRIILYVQNN